MNMSSSHPNLPKSVAILDGYDIHGPEPISRIGFLDGIIEINHGVPISEGGEALTISEEKALALGSLGLSTTQTGGILYKSPETIRDHRKGLFNKMGGNEGNDMSRATVAAFNGDVLKVEKPISNPQVLDTIETQAITRIGRGETNEQIANNLGVSERKIRETLGIKANQVGATNRTGLVTYGIVSGQVDPKNIVLPLPSHVTVIKSRPAENTSSGSQLLEATFQGGVISLDPDAKTPYAYENGIVTRSDNSTLTAQQGNTLLLNGVGLAGGTIAEATSTATADGVWSQRIRIANKLTGHGRPAGQLTVEALRNGNLQIEQYIETNIVALDSIALDVVSDAAKGINLESTALRLGESRRALQRHLEKTVFSVVPTEKIRGKLLSLVTYSILTRQYDPFTGKISPMY